MRNFLRSTASFIVGLAMLIVLYTCVWMRKGSDKLMPIAMNLAKKADELDPLLGGRTRAFFRRLFGVE